MTQKERAVQRGRFAGNRGSESPPHPRPAFSCRGDGETRGLSGGEARMIAGRRRAARDTAADHWP
ncbi:hypothetical protein D9R08_05875 [Rhodophyticola porphyridii]|uniref:Uncharacterized protein n=1 Tax=Rhodophyticola porphyridii TaxID=1852017 RepID=A0A3L9YA92_9RHOB|nr:hypothetical protein D9R08_05875 [Rhodophyticola porphyridii]